LREIGELERQRDAGFLLEKDIERGIRGSFERERGREKIYAPR